MDIKAGKVCHGGVYLFSLYDVLRHKVMAKSAKNVGTKQFTSKEDLKY